MANNTRITGDIASIPTPKAKTAAPLVQAVEPIKGDWDQNNNWGFTLNRKEGWPLVNTPPTIISVAQNPVFRGPPRARGILFTREDIYLNGYSSNDRAPSVQARITYGLGGISQQIVVDWGNTVINLPASKLTVEVIVTGSNYLDDFPTLAVLGSELGVLFSNELLPSDGFTTLTDTTMYSNLIVPIPKFAVGFMISADYGEDMTANAYSPAYVGTGPIQQWYAVNDETAIGTIYWLPTAATFFQLITSNQISCPITWILSV